LPAVATSFGHVKERGLVAAVQERHAVQQGFFIYRGYQRDQLCSQHRRVRRAPTVSTGSPGTVA